MRKIILLCIFVLTACTSGPAVAPEPADPALKAAKSIFEVKCSRCHSFGRALGKNKTPEQWRETVARMQKKAPDWISDADVNAILAYLNAVQGPK